MAAGVVAAGAQALGEVGEPRGGLGGQGVARLRRAEAVGLGEGGAEQVAPGAVEQVVEGEGVGLLHRVGEVGVDHDAVDVTGDEQRRVLEGCGVYQELGVGGVEVLVLALVFPAEAALAPDVGPALAAGGLGRALLEGEPGALRVGGDGVVEAEQAAEVVEVGLGGRAFLELDRAPFGDELGGGHAGVLDHGPLSGASGIRLVRRQSVCPAARDRGTPCGGAGPGRGGRRPTRRARSARLGAGRALPGLKPGRDSRGGRFWSAAREVVSGASGRGVSPGGGARVERCGARRGPPVATSVQGVEGGARPGGREAPAWGRGGRCPG